MTLETILAPVHWIPEVKRLERETATSLPSAAEVKNGRCYISVPPICLNDVHREHRSCTARQSLILCRTPLVRTLVIRIGLARSVNLLRMLLNKFALQITGCQIQYGTVLWLIELQIRRGRKV